MNRCLLLIWTLAASEFHARVCGARNGQVYFN